MGLVLLGLCCCSLIWSSAPKGIASLYRLGLDNQLERGDSVGDLSLISSLSEELLSLDSRDPNSLLSVGYGEFVKASQSEKDDSQRHLIEARDLTLQAITLRPLDYVGYAQLAYIETHLSPDFSSVRDALNKAQEVGPYEISTAVAGIEIYLSRWQELTSQEKVKAITYILQHNDYGLTLDDIDKILARSRQSKILCEVSGIKQLKLSYCH